MIIKSALTELRKLLHEANESISIDYLVSSGETYWLEKHGAYKSAYWHGVRYYFYEWLSETKSTAEAKRIINSPEMGTVIGEHVERMLD